MRSMQLVIGCALVAVMNAQVRAGGCETWLPGPLIDQPEGIDSTVLASTVWTQPNGPTLLVIGGNFGSAGGVSASLIAAWDGASWRALGSGMSGSVLALAVYNGDLIAGGNFIFAGGVLVNHVARWNGSVWQPLGAGLEIPSDPLTAACTALTVYNGELIAGGRFQTAGGAAVNNLARWNGTNWSDLAGGVTHPNPNVIPVESLAVHNNALYVGGLFNNAGSTAVGNIAKYLNGSWSALTSGVNGIVVALQSWNGELAVGGSFDMAGGMSAMHVARWNGTAWGAFGSGIGSSNINMVWAFQPFNGQLLAGGDFPNLLLAWNGSTWTPAGGGLSAPSFPAVTCLTVYNNNAIAGGNITSAGSGGVPVHEIAQWDGALWSGLDVPPAQIAAFETLGSRIVAGGFFTHSTTSFAPAKNLIAWNGTELSPITTGVNDTVRALKSYTTGSGLTLTRRLVVGGDFTVAGGFSANHIAQWNEPAFSAPSWSTLGAGFNNDVYALERFNNTTFAGGSFTLSGATAVNRIAQFNGTNWVALGSGMNGQVHALKNFNGFLYAGGQFTTAGGVTTGGLARWNGSTWSSLGGFVDGIVYSLEVHNNELIAGGTFSFAPNIFKYDGAFFSPMGVAGTNGPVTSLKSDGTSVYCAGGFTTAGGVSVNHLARWNANNDWSDVAGGTNEVLQALGLYHNEIQVGLGTSTGIAGAGGTEGAGAPEPGFGWVRFAPAGKPWVAQQPLSQSIDCGQDATFSIQPAAGYAGIQFAWRRNGLALNNGPTGHGSTISGATTATLTIANARSSDTGPYDCVLSSGCGSETSTSATLTVNNCCTADVTGDGAVNVGDLLAVISSWGSCAGCPADINADGVVNVGDLLAVINSWGLCP